MRTKQTTYKRKFNDGTGFEKHTTLNTTGQSQTDFDSHICKLWTGKSVDQNICFETKQYNWEGKATTQRKLFMIESLTPDEVKHLKQMRAMITTALRIAEGSN